MTPTSANVTTAAGVLRITRAGLEEISLVIEIQTEAAEWLKSRGIDQWQIDREQTGAYLRTAMTGYPPPREVYLAWRDAEPVATLALQSTDPRVWRAVDGVEEGDALYLHGFAVRRAFGGLGIGLALLRWAEGVAAANGKRFLRLDCMVENPGLRAYYQRAGYTHRGDVFGATWSASRYERVV